MYLYIHIDVTTTLPSPAEMLPLRRRSYVQGARMPQTSRVYADSNKYINKIIAPPAAPKETRQVSGFQREYRSQSQFPALALKKAPLKINHCFPNASHAVDHHQHQFYQPQQPSHQYHSTQHETFFINELLDLSQ